MSCANDCLDRANVAHDARVAASSFTPDERVSRTRPCAPILDRNELFRLDACAAQSLAQ